MLDNGVWAIFLWYDASRSPSTIAELLVFLHSCHDLVFKTLLHSLSDLYAPYAVFNIGFSCRVLSPSLLSPSYICTYPATQY